MNWVKHEVPKTQKMSREEKVALIKSRSKFCDLRNTFAQILAFHFCSTFNEHFFFFNICFFFYVTKVTENIEYSWVVHKSETRSKHKS